jgi:hypothetical protein
LELEIEILTWTSSLVQGLSLISKSDHDLDLPLKDRAQTLIVERQGWHQLQPPPMSKPVPISAKLFHNRFFPLTIYLSTLARMSGRRLVILD